MELRNNWLCSESGRRRISSRGTGERGKERSDKRHDAELISRQLDRMGGGGSLVQGEVWDYELATAKKRLICTTSLIIK